MIKLRQQRGAALFVGIFLITVVVLFAAVVALTSSTQHLSQARARLAEQAWYAAIARMESEIQQAIDASACPGTGSSNTFGFTTQSTCSLSTVQEGSATYNVFSISVSAAQGSLSTPVYARRSVRAQVTDLEL